jgi:hypothetical protein
MILLDQTYIIIRKIVTNVLAVLVKESNIVSIMCLGFKKKNIVSIIISYAKFDYP